MEIVEVSPASKRVKHDDSRWIGKTRGRPGGELTLILGLRPIICRDGPVPDGLAATRHRNHFDTLPLAWAPSFAPCRAPFISTWRRHSDSRIVESSGPAHALSIEPQERREVDENIGSCRFQVHEEHGTHGHQFSLPRRA